MSSNFVDNSTQITLGHSNAEVAGLESKYHHDIAQYHQHIDLLKAKLNRANKIAAAWQNAGIRMSEEYKIPREDINAIFQDEKKKLK